MDVIEEPEVPAKGSMCGCKCRVRVVIVVLLSFGMALIYGMKVGLHVVIVAMVNNTAVFKKEANHTSPCGQPDDVKEKDVDGPFEWDQTVVGWILSSYFYGYMVSELPGGRLAENLSARWVFFFAVFINVVCCLLSPIVSRLHWAGLLVLRVLQGLGGGMTFPAAHVMLAHWVPPLERGVLANIVYAGTCLGTVGFMLGSGQIAGMLGWEEVFYIEGGVSAVWLFFWAWLSADTPKLQKYITVEERAFIVDSLKEQTGHRKSLHPPVPWKRVLSSAPFLAILVTHTCSNWGWYMMLVELPQFMTHALGLHIKSNAVLTALPFLTMWIFSMCLSEFLEYLEEKDKISVGCMRKTATIIASAIPAACLGVLCFIECERTLAVVLMTVSITAIGGMFCGFLSNHIDIAPNYAGTLIAITNTVATIPGIAVPIVVGYLIDIDPGMNSWRIVFYITIGLYVIEIIVYSIFASGRVQDWNNS